MSREIFVYNLRLLRMAERKSAQDLSVELNLAFHRIADIEGNTKVRIKEEEIEAIAAYFNKSVEIITTIKAKIVFEK